MKGYGVAEETYVVYARKSPAENKRESHSIDYQLDWASEEAGRQRLVIAKGVGARYLKGESQAVVPGAYIDEGAHGNALVRPALWKMIEDAKAHKFSVLLLYRGDRLSRQFTTKKYILAALTQFGVRVIAGDNTSGDLTLADITGVYGASELRVLKERTIRGVRKAAETKWVGRVPVGFRPNGKGVVPTEEARELFHSGQTIGILLTSPEAIKLKIRSVTSMNRMFANLRAYDAGRLDEHLDSHRPSRERRLHEWQEREDRQEKELLKRLIDIIPSIRGVL